MTSGSAQSLTSLLAPQPGPAGSDVPYLVGGTTAGAAALEAAAQLLADDAMRIRCGGSPALASWRSRRDGGPGLTGTRAKAVATFAGMVFGLPGEPDKNEDHIQGHVAELLWNRLLAERVICDDGRVLVRVADVKQDPLEPGQLLLGHRQPPRQHRDLPTNSLDRLRDSVLPRRRQLQQRTHHSLLPLPTPTVEDKTALNRANQKTASSGRSLLRIYTLVTCSATTDPSAARAGGERAFSRRPARTKSWILGASHALVDPKARSDAREHRMLAGQPNDAGDGGGGAADRQLAGHRHGVEA